MTGAIALAVVLVIAVAGMSLAMQSQKAGNQSGPPRPPRPPRTPRPAPPPRRPRTERRNPPSPPPEGEAPVLPPDLELRGPELLRSGTPGLAKVVSVVDERTIGPVTRSRLNLRIEPEDGDPFEVMTRVAFPTPEARSAVKVGGTVPVRYDKDDHTRVVVELPSA